MITIIIITVDYYCSVYFLKKRKVQKEWVSNGRAGKRWVVHLGILVTPDLSHLLCKKCTSKSEIWPQKSFLEKFEMLVVVAGEVQCPEP